MAKKYYAVRVGRQPGIYETWDKCKEQVDKFPNARYKSFLTIEEAEGFMKGPQKKTAQKNTVQKKTTEQIVTPPIYAFVDGSFNSTDNTYGYGGFLCVNGERTILQGKGNQSDLASMRNVAGELMGCMAAVEEAIKQGLKEVTIYYDYLGIEKWVTEEWARNKEGTIAYHDYMHSIKDKITVKFVKVKGHSGIDGNEEADRLAKAAVGITQ